MARFLAVICAAFMALGGPVPALQTSQGGLALSKVTDGLRSPWAFGFLPGGEVLITERGGRLLLLGRDGGKRRIIGVPEVASGGQGGLMDVVVARDFARSREVFLSFSKAQAGKARGTAVAVARLSQDGSRLTDLRVIFEMTPGSRGGRHFGSRIVEARDGRLFITLGDRADRPSAQDLGRHNGSIVRIARDGSVPPDNPFVATKGAAPEIWSYGHRNPQGAALDRNGHLWAVEHGARGGDEINRIRKGRNYGWPVIAYGRHYSGGRIGEGTTKEGMEQPAHYWDPSIAPSGMMIYSGKLWLDWRGDIFVGSLKFDYISRVDGTGLSEVEQIRAPQTARVRDIREAPDGSIWILSEDRGALYRLAPE